MRKSLCREREKECDPLTSILSPRGEEEEMGEYPISYGQRV